MYSTEGRCSRQYKPKWGKKNIHRRREKKLSPAIKSLKNMDHLLHLARYVTVGQPEEEEKTTVS